ncbi:PREDICTED: uncharacterized protein LOC104825833 [Tarenaya hassleriana]|uniref:uncharacterized protein LOC104825833 n=1 Tax=Tarenaya hassleriana TaxID=28532 RepID=UPI00053C2788|nr:PREDICTED: uncharacterized protein LOC104825833 [Tarenaya hassleriana]
MDSIKGFHALGTSTILDSENYSFWKVKAMNLIKGIDEDAWSSVEEGWSAPTHVVDGEEILKPRSKWTTQEKRASTLNSKAITIIFNTVDKDEFKQIQGCKSAKEAWDSLELIHEGTSSVKRTRRDLIKHQFNMLQMGENESVKEFCGRLNALANEAEVLGKTYRDKQLVAKLLVSLPKKFMSHKSAFTMVNNVDTVSFKETVGAFAAHELELELYEKPKGATPNKGLAFHIPGSSEDPSQVSLEEDMAMIVKKYNRFFKKKSVTAGKLEPRNTGKCLECKGVGHWKAECPSIAKREAILKNLKDLQCYECKGYGHMKNECAAGKEEREEKEEEVSEEDLYKEMTKLYDINMKLIKEQKQSESTLTDLRKQLIKEQKEKDSIIIDLKKQLKEKEEKITLLQSQLDETMKKVRMLGSGTEKLDHLLRIGRTYSGHAGLGYTGGSINKVGNFVSGGKLGDENIVPDKNTPRIKVDLHPRKQYREHISCFHCGKRGHIRVNCYWRRNQVPLAPRWRQVWRRKDINRCNIACTSELNSRESQWYFDSGCSKHMTGDMNRLSTFEKSIKGGNVTFGDGRKGKILGKGNMNASGLPTLTDVNVVEGLKANLISISQLCDSGLQVHFTKDVCLVTNSLNKCVLTGKRTPSNCYTWDDQSRTELWHQSRGKAYEISDILREPVSDHSDLDQVHLTSSQNSEVLEEDMKSDPEPHVRRTYLVNDVSGSVNDPRQDESIKMHEGLNDEYYLKIMHEDGRVSRNKPRFNRLERFQERFQEKNPAR